MSAWVRDKSLSRKELDILTRRWEGGDIIDTKLMIRELIKIFREVEAERCRDSII